jgi:glucose/arabinose dehydrogenase
MPAISRDRMQRSIWLGLMWIIAPVIAAPAAAQLRLEPYVSGLTLPVGFVQDPATPAIQYVLEQGGTVRVILNGTLLATPFLDLSPFISSGGERGLLGIAFPPDYAVSGRFYVNFTNPAGNTVVARFLRSVNSPVLADLSSRFDLRWDGASGQRFIVQPFANHNGGHIAFGPDGYLYIGMGDGGAGDDPGHRAQTPSTLLGKMLRIDVNVPASNQDGYIIPATNPFQPGNALGALPEIWAFGLRNPWKFSFDSLSLGGTGALFIGDVGQNASEEVDYEPPGVGGRNYGWRNREGAHPNPDTLAGGDLPPAYLPLTDPIIEYPHPVGASVIGGVVYRGTAMRAAYRGRYFYADLNGRIWSAAILPTGNGAVTATAIIEHTGEVGGMNTAALISVIGTDTSGEIYIVSWSLGVIYRLTDPTGPVVPLPAADFNRDHKPDLVWFNDATRQLAAWNMGGGTFGERLISGNVLTAPILPAGWQVVGAADADGDGKTDLFLQSDAGLLAVWLFDGSLFRGGVSLSPGAVSDPLWRIRAVADFNHDGHADLVWQHGSTGQVAFWLLNGVNVIGYAIPAVGAPGPDWQVFGAGDANHDGQRDLFFQHRTLGLLAVWRMNGVEFGTGLLLSASPDDPGWQAVAACDLDGDGSADIVFQHASTATLAAWYLNGESLRFGTVLNPPSAGDSHWHVVGPR